MDASVPGAVLRSGRRLDVGYAGKRCVVDIHVVGMTKDRSTIMRVWRVGGGSAHGEPTGWKMNAARRGHSARILNERSAAPRPGHEPDDRL
jgi:hypothetical protein